MQSTYPGSLPPESLQRALESMMPPVSLRPSLLPPGRGDSTNPPRLTQPPETDEQGRRSIAPPAELLREIYKLYAVLMHQYSEGLDSMDMKKIKYLLQVQCQDLEQSDPLIGLLLYLENHKSKEVEVGSYRLVSPSIKSLNGDYLGPVFTDIFMAKLHGAIEKKFEISGIKILNTTFKGGTFVREKPKNPKENNLGNIEEEIKKLLIETLEGKKDQIQKTAEKRADKALNEDERVHLENINELLARLTSSQTNIQLALGKSDLTSKNPKNGALAIHQAQLAANYQANQFKKGTAEDKEIETYNEAKIIYEYLKAHQEVRTKVLTDEGTKVQEKWKDFFYVTAEGKLRMTDKAIKIYRTMKEFRKSEVYEAMTAPEQEEFETKMKFFGDYYGTINMVDVLKPWTYKNYGQFLKKIKDRVRLIKKQKKALTKGWKESKVRKLSQKVLKEVDLSLKDEGEKIIGNTRGQIFALLENPQDEAQEAVILSGDHIGFGAINQLDYQESLEKLVDLLQLSDEEKQAPNKATIEAKIQQLRENGGYKQFTETMQSIGDKGTERIVETKKILYESITEAGGTVEIDGSAGDEEKAIIQGLTLEKVQRILNEKLGDKPIRMAIAKAPGKLPRIPSELGPPDRQIKPWEDPVQITPNVRSALKNLFELYQGLQALLDTMKANDNQNGVQILEQVA